MTAPVAAYVQLPLDTSNTGKKRRTQTRVVGANTVHEDYVIPLSKRSILGFYTVNSTVQAIPSALQDPVSDAFLYLFNPVGATKKIAVSQIKALIQFKTLDTDIGNIVVTKFSATGTSSGTAVTPVPLDSTYTATSAVAVETVTGLTATIVGIIASWLLPVMEAGSSGTSKYAPIQFDWTSLKEDEEIILNAGEGIAIYSALGILTATADMVATVKYSEYE